MAKKKEPKEIKFYSPKRIIDADCTYNVIFGERSNGKSYAILKHGLEQYFKTGGQIAIVRRWKEDVIGRRASGIWSAINDNNEVSKLSGGKFSKVYYWNGKFYLANVDDNGKTIFSDEDVIGHCFALSENEHNKSTSFPRITTILFDEFLTNKVYLNDEFVLFMNTVSTIVRQRTNVKIFMLGNTVNKYCPYFAEMGLNNILEMKQGSIDIYTYGDSQLKVAVEYCSSISSQKENNFYFAFNNPKLHMITSGAWELDIYPHLPQKYKHKDIVFTYFIVFNDMNFQCEIVQDSNGEMFTFIHQKTTPLKDTENDLIYTLEYSYKLNYNRSIWKPINRLQERILWFFKTDRVFYQDNSVGDAINNYLKICERV